MSSLDITFNAKDSTVDAAYCLSLEPEDEIQTRWFLVFIQDLNDQFSTATGKSKKIKKKQKNKTFSQYMELEKLHYQRG